MDDCRIIPFSTPDQDTVNNRLDQEILEAERQAELIAIAEKTLTDLDIERILNVS